MKETTLLLTGIVLGVLMANLFGAKVRAFIVSMLTKTASKIEGK